MINNFSFHFFVKITIFIFSLPIFFWNLFIYENSILIYIIFTIITFFYLNHSLEKKSSYYSLFISVFLYLGFWFKFSINNILQNQYIERVGSFDFLPKNIDQVIFVSCIGILGFMLPSLLYSSYYKFFNFKSVKKMEFKNIEKFYFNNKKKIILILFIILFFFVFTNLIYNIYQKGDISYTGNTLIKYFYGWLLQFGLASFFVFIIFFEKNNKRIWIYILFAMIESFFSGISLLSRNLIFLHFYLFIGIEKLFKKLNKDLFLLCIFSFLLFIVSNLIIYKERLDRGEAKASYNLEIKKKIDKQEKNTAKSYIKYISKTNPLDYYLFEIVINRFVGIDGVMAVNAKQNKNFSDYFESFKHSDVKKKYLSFYDREYLHIYKKEKLYNEFNNLNYQFSPGFIAHAYMSGSIVFVFLICFFTSLIILSLERFLKKVISNSIFVSLIMFFISYRIIHFGYDPLNSYKLLLALTLNIILYYLIEAFLKVVNK